MRRLIKKIVSLLGDKFYNYFGYCYLHWKCGLRCNGVEWHQPERFNHKIIWMKMNYRHPDANMYVDKIRAKEHVSRIIGSDHVAKIFRIWADPKDISFDEMPNSFVLKCNHGSGMNLIVHDKSKIDVDSIRATINEWLSIDYYSIGREYQYKGISPAVFAEELLEHDGGGDMVDYKFFCFHGAPYLVQVDFDRYSGHKRNFYDLDWRRMPFRMLYPEYPFEHERPASFSEMVEMSSRLASGFPFVRVDWYECSGKPYFGELTFHPEGGFGPIIPDEWDIRMGRLLKLPLVGEQK